MFSRPFAQRRYLLAGLLALYALACSPPGITQASGDLERFPLSPPDISTPQATVSTFIREITAALDAYYAGDRALMHARTDRAFQTFATEYPASDTEQLRGMEIALYLLEVLIRIELPPEVLFADAAPAVDVLPAPWTIPHTEIRLVPVDGNDGTLLGYRFSAETLARLPDFFVRVRNLPVREGFEKYDGAVERFRLGPGFAAPTAVVHLVQGLSPVWYETFGGEPWWKWAALVIAVLAALAVFAVAWRLAAALSDSTRRASLSRGVVRALLIGVAMLLVAFLQFVVVDVIRLTGVQRTAVVSALSVLAHSAVIWLIFAIAGGAAAAIIRFREMGIYALDAQLIRLVSKLVAVLLALYALVNMAENLGISVAPVLAGLGVGGLAVALAVRPTIENIFAGFVLFADAPVRVGDFCEFGDKMGTIEAIGLRSVRVRALDRTVITVPNADFCQLQLVNFTRRDGVLLRSKLQLRYETTPDQLRLVLARLRELLIKHPRVSPDPARVRFVEYGASSLDLEIFAIVETRDFSEFLAIQEDLNLRIKDVVEDSGSGFAFPSQTLYLERGDGVDADLTRSAEIEVERWRSENRLPFPDYDEGTRSELSNTLDYPPEGSPTRPISGRD